MRYGLVQGSLFERIVPMRYHKRYITVHTRWPLSQPWTSRPEIVSLVGRHVLNSSISEINFPPMLWVSGPGVLIQCTCFLSPRARTVLPLTAELPCTQPLASLSLNPQVRGHCRRTLRSPRATNAISSVPHHSCRASGSRNVFDYNPTTSACAVTSYV